MRKENAKTKKFKEYLKTHPLALEMLHYILTKVKEKEVTSTFVASATGRALSTVYESLKEMESKGIMKSRKEGVARYFCLANTEMVKHIFEDEKIWMAFAKTSVKLRHKPYSLELFFKEELKKELTKYVEIVGSPAIGTFMGTTKLDFTIEHTSGGVVGVQVRKMREMISPAQYSELGRIFDIIKGPIRFFDMMKGLIKMRGLVSVFLLPKRHAHRDFDEWKFKELIQLLSSDKIKLDTIVRYVDDKDLMNLSFIKELARQVIDSVNGLAVETRSDDKA